MSYNEAAYESAIIELFENELNYDYIYGPDVERDFTSPLYDEVLEESLRRINKGAPYDAIQDALHRLRSIENGELSAKTPCLRTICKTAYRRGIRRRARSAPRSSTLWITSIRRTIRSSPRISGHSSRTAKSAPM